jgi:hypothetical protein
MVERKAKSDLWAELDAEGEAKVRDRLVTAFYGEVSERRAVVLEWLRSKEVARIEAFQSRQTEAASRAADAAERAGAAVRRQAAEVARASASPSAGRRRIRKGRRRGRSLPRIDRLPGRRREGFALGQNPL